MKISLIIYLINTGFFYYSFLFLTPNLWTKKLYKKYFIILAFALTIEVLILLLLGDMTKRVYSLFIIPFSWLLGAYFLDKLFLFLVNRNIILEGIEENKKELVFNMVFFYSRKFDNLPEVVRNTGSLFSILLFIFQLVTLQIIP